MKVFHFLTKIGGKSLHKIENNRLDRLKILLVALYDTGYDKIRKTLFIKLVFLIDHYLDGKLSEKPLIFGYNFYVYKYGVFTAEILADLERLGISYEKDDGVYIKIEPPSPNRRKLVEKNKELYNKFRRMIEKYVIPFEENPDELSNYILENLLGIHPGQKVFYYYTSVKELIKRVLSKKSP